MNPEGNLSATSRVRGTHRRSPSGAPIGLNFPKADLRAARSCCGLQLELRAGLATTALAACCCCDKAIAKACDSRHSSSSRTRCNNVDLLLGRSMNQTPNRLGKFMAMYHGKLANAVRRRFTPRCSLRPASATSTGGVSKVIVSPSQVGFLREGPPLHPFEVSACACLPLSGVSGVPESSKASMTPLGCCMCACGWGSGCGCGCGCCEAPSGCCNSSRGESPNSRCSKRPWTSPTGSLPPCCEAD
mmetsp:Transcript_47066/g.112044  ORF Transcript_47066/g.112044 Transcript_47066/m.112044 type:complete len:245 (-) Transcript_47066:294-1028(-)